MIKIISDSTCDLSQDLLERYDISILPLHVHMGDEEYEDGVKITPQDIYEWSDRNKTTPKTAAPSITEVEEVFRPYVEAGNEIICFSISDDMSTTGNVMRMTAQKMEKEQSIHVIDSANLSTGVGHLVIEAAVMAQEGMSAGEIVEKIEALKTKVRASFVVDTLTYLYRGGRCSGLTAVAGSMLKIHPSIVVEEGKMHPKKKYRGKMQSVILSYVKDMEEDLKRAKRDRVFITHSGCDEEIVRMVYDYLKGLDRFEEILETRAGSVISSHCGPGTLGVLFIAEY